MPGESDRETAEFAPTTILGADSRPLSGSGSNPFVNAVQQDTQARPALPAAIGPYRVLSEIGRGGMGVVYKAQDQENRLVAIKMVLDPRAAGEEALRRFEREARAAIKLRHPNIVSVHATGTHEGRPYLVMELIEGDSLESLLRRGPVPTRQVIEIVRAIALALDHAHANGVVHRDLKPENILVDHDGKPHLADFGLARDQSIEDNLTTTGTVLGTPAYMAPEQAGGETHEQGPHCDIYGLGAVLYRSLAGRPPFHASSVSAMMKKVLFDSAIPPSRYNPAVPHELDEIVLRCLSKRPAFRYPSGTALAEELRRFVAGEQLQQRPAQPWWRRHARAALLAVLAVLGTAGAATWFVLVERPAQRRSRALAEVEVAAANSTDAIVALDHLDLAIKLDPELAAAWHERGKMKFQIFDLDGALADLTRASELDSRDAETWLDLARLHIERAGPVPADRASQAVFAEWDAAISDASRAIALAPKNPHAWLERGRARHFKRDDRADEDLRKCMSFFPEYSPDPVYQTAGNHLRAIRFGH